ncbi:cell wall protein [Streptomyces stelliscabiei]|uniref:cell wall protein n=1 Tax=Streptomyces stelliscabiei TaxID=146820 RepID=UPI00299FEFE0|nr:cell wall protein [Streptomyces stelliscabiei]MDX2550024.1 cell wall protein [Streptomyces stelliscabiei]MDX2610556.1 cell wall protein [Streptomyces stelliscabiei]MDX2635355.1 cell wall protein [Streptomyces stelliscabiei]MDX2660742.1 cell wall protein [Streptomyces stelliscabiei]MDX2710494.1 cell wall protein [Streptomyces stelliscabiei]
MSSHRRTVIAGSLLTASFTSVMILGFAASADDEGGLSKHGGKTVDAVPAGVKLSTLLSKEIKVDKKSKETDITGVVKNEGSKASGEIRLLVVGFDGLTVKNVEGCSAIPEGDLPDGANSGFACAIDDLAAGKSKTYAIDATYDLSKKGKICLPVQNADGSKTWWQQGPVPFGATNQAPNEPATPLLLGTDNSPVTPGGGDGGGDDGGGGGGGNGKDGKPDELPQTGPADRILPLGLVGAALVSAGAAGLWWNQRRARQEG